MYPGRPRHRLCRQLRCCCPLCYYYNKGNRAIVTGRLSQRTYETREGEKRNIVEVVADSIGPDLRWATCEVTRTERTSAPQQAKKANPSYAEEEPF
jgi:single-strand DNA-binding protein